MSNPTPGRTSDLVSVLQTQQSGPVLHLNPLEILGQDSHCENWISDLALVQQVYTASVDNSLTSFEKFFTSSCQLTEDGAVRNPTANTASPELDRQT